MSAITVTDSIVIGSTGTSCVACHMAKKNMGLDYGLVRYHRIGSPTDPKRALADRPLECALCHADYSVERIVAQMEAWWGKTYDRAALRAGSRIDGPALIEEHASTTVLHPGDRLEVDAFGDLIIEIRRT